MTIRFLGTPLSTIDRLCSEEEIVKVSISTYNVEHYPDGSAELVQTGEYGGRIKSSKDLVQFDYCDMKKLANDERKKLR